MMDDKLIITPAEAEALLIDGAETVHNYANPAAGFMIGVDYERAHAIQAFDAAHQIEIGGPGCKASKHPIVVWDKPNRYSFFEADMAKVDAFEASRAALEPKP